MIAITKRFLLLSPLLVLARRAFGQDAATPAPNEAAMKAVTHNAIDRYILPSYQGLEAATATLVSAMKAACQTPTATPSPALKSAFEGVIKAWARVDFLRFGPIAEKGRLERFSFLPDKHGTGARQLRQILAKPDPALLEPGMIATRSAAVQGLQAFESLTFDAPDDAETASYRCTLALRIAENLHQIADDTLVEWARDGGWRQLMEQPGGDNIVYRNATEPVIEVLKAIVTGLQQMRDQRLLPALGKSFDTAKPARGAFVKSGMAFPYLLASSAAIESLIEQSDLFSLAPAAAPKLLAESKAATADFENSINVGSDWQAAFADKAAYDSLQHAFDVLKTMEDIFNYQFTAAAGIQPGFNALDGD
ncbi:imelysin family protein [Kaistia dalseonensis]|uniref:Lipoprotein n=1 Tax=Kaistia dalseonensis TaxID=410840 RepID=A0ABU0H6A7_9HYPH|nr:imelysin family protein [Kaistia dalseonensis]MCX5495252.1 imelysin family protein [Kaistia dalseonensis]MDQ0437838.1 putative lipoprotein [Kaistia dalseonensis]